MRHQVIKAVFLVLVSMAGAFAAASIFLIAIQLSLPPSDEAYGQGIFKTLGDPFVAAIATPVALVSAALATPLLYFCLRHRRLTVALPIVFGSVLAAVAGILYGLSYPMIDPLMGIMPGLKAFIAAVLGGIGNVPGAVVGGLIIGVVESFIGGSRFSNFRDAIAFIILIAILLFRPSGLFGKYQAEKV